MIEVLFQKKNQLYFVCDRNYEFYQLYVLNQEQYLQQVRLGYSKLRYKNAMDFQIVSVYDGEMVQDNFINEDGYEKLHLCPTYLVFDCLFVGGQNLMALEFRDRLLKAHEYIVRNHTIYRLKLEKDTEGLKKWHKMIQQNKFIWLYMKDMFEIWHTKDLFNMIEYKDPVKDQEFLVHENDGLIFTVNQCPYYPGTCEEIVKWKPLHMNSIDF